MDPFIGPKNIQKLKVAPEKKIEILELCCRTFFFLESCLESGKNTDLANLRPWVPTVVEFPWNDPSNDDTTIHM
jgi:hypothetical protein